jgi:hypothetical protein
MMRAAAMSELAADLELPQAADSPEQAEAIVERARAAR